MKRLGAVLFIAAVCAQVGILVFLIAKRRALIAGGRVVRLQCRPIDPRSLFSGDYVVLNYDISNLSREKKALNVFNEPITKKMVIYVALRQARTEKFWQAMAFSADPARLRLQYPGAPVVRGRVQNRSLASIRYGIETYFVPQYEGKRIEQEVQKANVSADVALSADGEAALKRLYIDETEVRFY